MLIQDLSEQQAIKATHKTLDMSALPDRLFVTNDCKAAVCMQELQRNNIGVPADIAAVTLHYSYPFHHS